MMAAAGILGEYKGSQAREVTMTLADYEALRKNMVADEVAGYADLTHERAEDEDENSEDYDSPVEEVDDEDTEEENEEDDEK
jgi:hypothetical protein